MYSFLSRIFLLIKDTKTEQVVSIEVLEGSLCVKCFGTVSV